MRIRRITSRGEIGHVDQQRGCNWSGARRKDWLILPKRPDLVKLKTQKHSERAGKDGRWEVWEASQKTAGFQSENKNEIKKGEGEGVKGVVGHM